MIFRQWKSVIHKLKTETRRTSVKDTYRVGRDYPIIPKRAKPTVFYRWIDKEVDAWHEHYSASTPKPLLLDRKSMGGEWIEGRVLILAKHWEPLHAITEEGAICEGIREVYSEHTTTHGRFMHDFSGVMFLTAVSAYADLWDSINGKSKLLCWAANPSVCVHKFELVEE